MEKGRRTFRATAQFISYGLLSFLMILYPPDFDLPGQLIYH